MKKLRFLPLFAYFLCICIIPLVIPVHADVYSNSISYTDDEQIESLGKPTNVTLSDDCVVTWDEIPLANHYWVWAPIYQDGKYIGGAGTHIYSWSVKDGRCSFDFSNTLHAGLIKYGLLGQELTIQAHVHPYGTITYQGNTYEIEGKDSDYSNTISYMNDGWVESLGKPTNVTLSDDCVVTWDEIPLANRYWVWAPIYQDGKYIAGTGIHIYNWAVKDGKCSFDFSNTLREGLIKYGLLGQTLTISVHVHPYSTIVYQDKSYEIEGQDSDYSNTILYTNNEQIESLGKPTNVTLSDDCIVTWDEIPLANHYWVWAPIYQDGKYVAGTGTHIYSWNVNDGKCSYDFSYTLREGLIKYGLLGQSVTVSIHVHPYGTITYQGKSYEIEGQDSDYSNSILYTSDRQVDLSSYSTLVLPPHTVNIDTEAFIGIAAEVVIIPENCRSIGPRAFANCEALKYVVIAPDSTIVIDDTAFEGSNVKILHQK